MLCTIDCSIFMTSCTKLTSLLIGCGEHELSSLSNVPVSKYYYQKSPNKFTRAIKF